MMKCDRQMSLSRRPEHNFVISPEYNVLREFSELKCRIVPTSPVGMIIIHVPSQSDLTRDPRSIFLPPTPTLKPIFEEKTRVDIINLTFYTLKRMCT